MGHIKGSQGSVDSRTTSERGCENDICLKVVQPSVGKYGQSHLRTNHFNRDVVE